LRKFENWNEDHFLKEKEKKRKGKRKSRIYASYEELETNSSLHSAATGYCRMPKLSFLDGLSFHYAKALLPAY
jgi:hypothetical protein